MSNDIGLNDRVDDPSASRLDQFGEKWCRWEGRSSSMGSRTFTVVESGFKKIHTGDRSWKGYGRNFLRVLGVVTVFPLLAAVIGKLHSRASHDYQSKNITQVVDVSPSDSRVQDVQQSVFVAPETLSYKQVYEKGLAALDREENIDQAVAAITEAANGGYAPALHCLGLLYQTGEEEVISQDVTKAIQYHQAAAKQGHIPAKVALGVLYLRDPKNAEDVRCGIQHLQDADGQRDGEAAFTLGLCHEKGVGVDKDEGRAVQYYLRALDGGSAEGAYRLGLCYESGTGTRQNQGLAVDCFKRASKLGHENAKMKLKNLE